jgi:hypothetical protein
MTHPILRVVAFEIVATYSIRVRFDDGTSRVINLEPVLAGELYGPLRDPMFFRAARIDPESHTIVWPNGADFDPATLHDWPSHAEAFARRAKAWSAGTRRFD